MNFVVIRSKWDCIDVDGFTISIVPETRADVINSVKKTDLLEIVFTGSAIAAALAFEAEAKRYTEEILKRRGG